MTVDNAKAAITPSTPGQDVVLDIFPPAAPSTNPPLNLLNGASLDIANDTVLIHASTRALASKYLDQLTDWVKNGYHGGDWLGTRGLEEITSSWAAADPNTSTTGAHRALGIFLNSNDNNINVYTPVFSSYAGHAVDANTIIIRPTVVGDMAGNGFVDGTDVSRIGVTFNGGATSGRLYQEGDLNYDRLIDNTDVAMLSAAFPSLGNTTTLPEAVPPALSISGMGHVYQNYPYTLSLTSALAGQSLPNVHHYTIDWGDSLTSPPPLSGNPPPTATHSFASPGTYDILITGYSGTGQIVYLSNRHRLFVSALSLTALATATDRISLTWATVPNAAGYRLDASTDGGATFFDSVSGVLVDLSAPTQQGIVPILDAGTPYTFRLTAYDNSGDIASSPLVSATTDQAVPGAPVSLSGVLNGDNSVSLTWGDVSSRETSYTLQRSTDLSFPNGMTVSSSLPPNSQSYHDTTLQGPGTYYYRVFCSNSVGSSDFSNVFALDTSNPPIPPSGGGGGSPPPAPPRTLLVAFNGYDVGNRPPGNFWLDEIAIEEGNSTKPAGDNSPYKASYTSLSQLQASRDLLSLIDTNGDHVILAAEVALVRVEMVGYSLGCLTAINLARSLSLSTDMSENYKLDVAVPISRLVTIDPVKKVLPGIGIAQPIVFQRGPVPSTVSQYKNYFQTKGGGTTFNLYLAGSSQGGAAFNNNLKVGTDTYDPPFGGLTGTANIPSNAGTTTGVVVTLLGQQYAKNVDYQTNFLAGATHYDADLKANNVQHDTIPWFVRGDVLTDLV